ncbi:hypothetical protein Kpol_1071p14, partial [Vanderwaltozyma polyspora DSM 70294]
MQLPKYVNKPFKPPRSIGSSSSSSTPSPKPSVLKRSVPSIDSVSSLKKPKSNDCVSEPCKHAPSSAKFNDDIKHVFTAMYRKSTMKKHKTWTGDGYALYKITNKVLFYDDGGKYLASTTYSEDIDSIYGNIFKYGSLEFQIDYEIKDKDEISKTYSAINNSRGKAVENSKSKPVKRDETPMKDNYMPLSQLFTAKIKPKSKFQNPALKTEIKHQTNSLDSNSKAGTVERKYLPVFDVTKIESPIIMNKASDAEVDVIIDPLLGKFLREHQKQGVKFMYDCIIGFCRPEEKKDTDCSNSLILEKDYDINGCLLADEMGLGKTLMTITLIWTLLKQTAYPSKVLRNQSGMALHGAYRKFIVVCPVTLIDNWKKEFAKWLTLARIGILTLKSKNNSEKDKFEVKGFLRVQRTYQVLIIGYEKLLSVSEELLSGKDNIDMLICDEGHRLKNGSSKILNILKSLDVKSKILLSGTPIQNDLNEFFTII